MRVAQEYVPRKVVTLTTIAEGSNVYSQSHAHEGFCSLT